VKHINITELKRNIDITEVLAAVSTAGDEYRLGAGWRSVRCPFHNDKLASAAVNSEAGRFKCHGCDVSGDIIDLAQAHLGPNTTIQEAGEWLSRFSR
jgi:DNA primase